MYGSDRVMESLGCWICKLMDILKRFVVNKKLKY